MTYKHIVLEPTGRWVTESLSLAISLLYFSREKNVH